MTTTMARRQLIKAKLLTSMMRDAGCLESGEVANVDLRPSRIGRTLTIWCPHLERAFLTFEDLECRELLEP